MRRSSRSQGPRRKKVWADFRTAGTLAVAANVQHDLLGTYRSSGGSTQGVTVLRTVLHWVFAVNPIATATFSVDDRIELGLIVAAQGPVSTDVDPLGKPHLDWMLNSRIYPGAGLAGTAGKVSAGKEWFVDLSAQRKIEEIGSSLILAWSNTTLTVVGYVGHVRTLLLLP